MTDGAFRSLSLFSKKQNSIYLSVCVLNLAGNLLSNAERDVSSVQSQEGIQLNCISLYWTEALCLAVCSLSQSHHHIFENLFRLRKQSLLKTSFIIKSQLLVVLECVCPKRFIFHFYFSPEGQEQRLFLRWISSGGQPDGQRMTLAQKAREKKGNQRQIKNGTGWPDSIYVILNSQWAADTEYWTTFVIRYNQVQQKNFNMLVEKVHYLFRTKQQPLLLYRCIRIVFYIDCCR